MTLDPVFTETTKFFISQGVLGFIALILAWAYWKCRAEKDKLHQERLGDFKATLETIHANSAAISDVVQATRARADAAAAIAEAQRMLTTEHTRSIQEILRLRDVVSELESKISELREELVRRGAV